MAKPKDFNSGKLNIMHQNMQCLMNKVGLIEAVACELNLDVLCLTEHWAKEDELLEYPIQNYPIAAYYCRTTSAHGGVAIYSRLSGSQIKVMHEIINLSSDLDCEIACVEIVEIKCVLVSVYRSPLGNLSSFFDIMEMVFSHLTRFNK